MATTYSISDYLEDKLLDKIFRNTDFTVSELYVSLHTDDPGEDGSNESADPGYARQLVTFSAPSDQRVLSDANISFGPFDTPFLVEGVGIWDAVSGGNLLWTGAPWRGQYNIGFEYPASPCYEIDEQKIMVSITNIYPGLSPF